MSKSDPSDQSRINLTDSADSIVQKFRRAKTDPLPLPDDPAALADRPEARNLIGIYAALSNKDVAQVVQDFAGLGWGAFKDQLADLTEATLAPIRTQTARLLDDPEHLEAALRQGAEKARAVADPIVREAERIVGFLT